MILVGTVNYYNYVHLWELHDLNKLTCFFFWTLFMKWNLACELEAGLPWVKAEIVFTIIKLLTPADTIWLHNMLAGTKHWQTIIIRHQLPSFIQCLFMELTGWKHFKIGAFSRHGSQAAKCHNYFQLHRWHFVQNPPRRRPGPDESPHQVLLSIPWHAERSGSPFRRPLSTEGERSTQKVPRWSEKKTKQTPKQAQAHQNRKLDSRTSWKCD